MNLPNLLAVIDAYWDNQLTRMPPGRRRTVWLTSCHRLVATWLGQQSLSAIEVGTYTEAVKLADFRDDVVFAYEQMRRASASSRR